MEALRVDRGAATAFGVDIAASLFVLVHVGRHMWFYEDDWTWIQRRLNVAGLFYPFFQHWITVPLLVYHLLYWLFGINYLPYQLCTIMLHLALAILMRAVMRRAGVGPWIATVFAGAFVLFGAGHEGIMVSVQMSLVGSAVFGTCQLLCADHDGPFDKRDALGLVFGLLALMSSGIGTIMVVIVGLAVLIRRGWQMALLDTVPLVIVNAVWFVAERHHEASRHPRNYATGAIRWIITGERTVFVDIGAYRVVAIGLGVLLVVGLALAWGRLPAADLRRRAAAPAALLLGGPVLFALISIQRGYLTGYETESRFANLAAAFSLPALAIAADAVARRWRALAPVVIALLFVGLVANVGRFPPESNFPVGFFRHDKAMLLGAAYSPLAAGTPRGLQPYAQLFHARGLTMGFLVDARRAGRLPPPPHLTQADQNELLVRLGVEQLHAAVPADVTCRAYYRPVVLHPKVGAVYALNSGVAINYGVDTVDTAHADLFDPGEGKLLRILLPNLQLTLHNIYDPTYPFAFCSRPASMVPSSRSVRHATSKSASAASSTNAIQTG